MTQPLVSVVTPFYNTEPYLEECIESVLAQRYENFEYILANNCSTDRSRDIAQKYASRDKRVKLIDNERFLTQAQNYNNALRHISPYSKYCKVVQADDWIFPECLSSMVGLAEAHPSVALVGAYGQIEERVYFFGLPLRSGNSRAMMSAADSGPTACTFSGRRPAYSIVAISSAPGSDFYDESCPLEDADVCFELLKDRDFGFVHQVLTFTRRENDSITTQVKMYGLQPLLKLMTILRHGQAYLEPSDYARLRDAATDGYHRSLGDSVVRGPGTARAFWSFHQQGMACCGFKVSWRLVAIFMPSRPRWIYCSTRKALPRGFGGDGVSDTGLRRRHRSHAALHSVRVLGLRSVLCHRPGTPAFGMRGSTLSPPLVLADDEAERASDVVM